MLAHFIEGIKQYRSWGPPKLDSLPMTCEELRFAQELNSWEGDVEELSTVTLMNKADDYFDDKLNQNDIEVPVSDVSEEGIHAKENCTCEELPLCCNNMVKLNEVVES